jgi:hypothetical protein
MKFIPGSITGTLRGVAVAAVSLVALMVAQTSLRASTNLVNLVSGNSSVSIDLQAPVGMFNWSVDGANQLNQQQFFFRIGSSGPQASLNSLGAPVVVPSGGNVVSATYSGVGFTIQTTYSLTGSAPGSGNSGLGEQIKIQNLGGAPLLMHFFQYADFNIPGSVALGTDLGGRFNEALILGTGISLSEDIDTSLAPGANRGEAAIFNSTLLNLLGPSAYNLNNNAAAGPGHTTWAFQWDPNDPLTQMPGIPAGGTFIISKTLSIEGVPEPGTLAIASLGLLALGAWHWHRRRATR